MPRLTWDGAGKKLFNYGVSQGVLFLYDPSTETWQGQAWDGLSNVTESPDGADVNDKYADNQLYSSIRGVENFGGTIEAYTAPDDFDRCVGRRQVLPGVTLGQQPREKFCFAWRTEIGNDLNDEAGYEIHIVYNCTANVTDISHATTEDSVDFEPLSFDFDSNPVPVTGYKPTSKLTISSLTTSQAAMGALEDIIYGGNDSISFLPMPDTLFASMRAAG